MSDVVLNKVQEVFRKVFKQPELIIQAATKASDTNMWDSLTHIQLITEIEQEFKLEFSLDEVMNFTCVGDIIDCISKKQRIQN